MNKTELIDAIATEAKVSKSEARKILEALLKVMSDALEKGKDIKLIRFGSFTVVPRSERTVHHPKTGISIKVSAKNVVKFKAGSDLSCIVGGDIDTGPRGK